MSKTSPASWTPERRLTVKNDSMEDVKFREGDAVRTGAVDAHDNLRPFHESGAFLGLGVGRLEFVFPAEGPDGLGGKSRPVLTPQDG